MLERLLADWPLKLLSLGLAFGVWVSITGEESIRRNFQIGLDPQLRENHIVAGPLPTQVTVRLEGPTSVIRKIDPLTLAVRLPLTDQPTGERDVQLTEAHVDGLPPRAAVDGFEPDRVHVVVDERRRRMLPVKPNLVGELPAGFARYGATVKPQRVLVEGPAARVNVLQHVSTDPVTLANRTRPFIERVGAIPAADHVRIVDPQPSTGAQVYEVQVDVDVSPEQRAIEGLAVVANTTWAVSLRPETVTVLLSGPPSVLAPIQPSQVRVEADVAELTPEAGARRVSLKTTIELPPELTPKQLARVRIESIKPPQVTARASEQEP